MQQSETHRPIGCHVAHLSLLAVIPNLRPLHSLAPARALAGECPTRGLRRHTCHMQRNPTGSAPRYPPQLAPSPRRGTHGTIAAAARADRCAPAPPHSLHLLRCRPCMLTDATPSTDFARTAPPIVMLDPPHSLHRLRTRLC